MTFCIPLRSYLAILVFALIYMCWSGYWCEKITIFSPLSTSIHVDRCKYECSQTNPKLEIFYISIRIYHQYLSFLQCVIDHQGLPRLSQLLTTSHQKSIKIGACWAISKITGGNSEQIQVCVIKVLNQ